MQIQAILFDKDGTLIDFDKTFAPATKLVINELSGSQDIAQQLADAAGYDLASKTFADNSVIIAGSVEDIAKVWLPILKIDLGDAIKKVDELFLQHTTKTISPFDFLIPTLQKLHSQNIILGLATNDSQLGGETHMAAVGATPYLSHIFGYDSGFGAKPSGGMIRAFAEKIDIPTKNIAMVGDSRHDILAGIDAGAITIAVGGNNGSAELKAELNQADYLVDNIADILPLVFFD